MPRANPLQPITTKFGRVVYDRKPKAWRLRDVFRVGKKVNLRFWLIPGNTWLRFLNFILGSDLQTDFGAMPIEEVGSFEAKKIQKLTKKSVDIGLESGLVFINQDDWEAD